MTEWRGERRIAVARRSKAQDTPGTVRQWLLALDRVPWLYSVAFPLWVVCSIVFGVLFGVAEDWVPHWLYAPLVCASCGAAGLLMILLSRPLAASEAAAPFWARWLGGTWGSAFDWAPSAFRLWGSGGVGYAVGRLVYVASLSEAGGAIVGFAVGLSLWVWTWFVFSELEE